jgi:ATP synthase protein I
MLYFAALLLGDVGEVLVLLMHQREQTPVAQRARRMAYAFVGVQTAVMLLASLLYLLDSVTASRSALLGGLAIVLPSLGFAFWLFRVTSARAARKILRVFYVGEIAKIFLSAMLAAIFVCLLAVDLLPFWIGFIAALVGFWLAPAIVSMDVSKGKRV